MPLMITKTDISEVMRASYVMICSVFYRILLIN